MAGAGHPPPLVVGETGPASILELAGSVPLGVIPYPNYRDVHLELEPGSTLVLYTDGLVEDPRQSLDEGLDRLRMLVDESEREPAALRDAIVDGMLPSGAMRDDAAVLVARTPVLSDPLHVKAPADLQSIPLVRRAVGRWLHERGASEAEAQELSLACSEACANAIEHAYSPAPAVLEVHATVNGDGAAIVSVEDFGSWRTPRGGHRGRGLKLMEGLTDSMEVITREGGTTVRLSRLLKDRRS
jgi:anti-sigma regulatory factor (Ser/Thr protein kinase)